MHHPTDSIAHTTAFIAPAVYWMEPEIAQGFHHEGSVRRPIAPWADAVPRNYISHLEVFGRQGNLIIGWYFDYLLYKRVGACCRRWYYTSYQTYYSAYIIYISVCIQQCAVDVRSILTSDPLNDGDVFIILFIYSFIFCCPSPTCKIKIVSTIYSSINLSIDQAINRLNNQSINQTVSDSFGISAAPSTCEKHKSIVSRFAFSTSLRLSFQPVLHS